MRELFYLNKYFVKYKTRFFAGILFVTLSNIFALIPPRIFRISIDLVVDNLQYFNLVDGFNLRGIYFNQFNLLLLIIFAVIVSMTLLKGFFMFLMRQTIIVMSRWIEYDLKNEIYANYQKLTASFYKRNNTGDLMSRATEDVGHVRMYLGPAIMYAINLTVMFSLVIFTMFKINAYLSFIVLLPLPILSISIYKVSDIINKKSARIQEKISGLTSMAQETFSGIRVLKSYVREKNSSRRFNEACVDYKEESLGLAKVQAFFAPLMLSLIGLSTILVVYVGGLEVAKGRFTPGNIAEFVFYINMLTWPVASLGWLASLVQRAAASQKRINDFLHTVPDINNDQAKSIEKIGSIVFDNVSFTYPDTGIEALKSINLEIKEGEKIAVIGRTGSGKSTLAELILRTYDVSEGYISFSGKDIRTLYSGSYRDRIGYVPQDVFLFSDSIDRNIRFGNEDIGPEEVRKAAFWSDVILDIEQLPEKYKTIVGERGVTLSGGQKQRVSIARALVKNPELVILDDCLSAVDAVTEERILRNFNRALKNKTLIFVTHRIFSLMDFDTIYVLNKGRIEEQGTHEQLLSKKGLYYDLFLLQQEEVKVLE